MSPPPETDDVRVLFDRPGREWSDDEKLRVAEWLYEAPQLNVWYRLAYQRLHDAMLSQDAWQEFLIRRFEGLVAAYDPARRRFPGYIQYAFRQYCLRPPACILETPGEALEPDNYEGEIPYPDPDDGPEVQSLAEIEVQDLMECIAALPETYRDVISLQLQELDPEEIEAALCINAATRRQRRSRAIKQLRECMARKSYLLGGRHEER